MDEGKSKWMKKIYNKKEEGVNPSLWIGFTV
jgi:hypothetical protein